MFTYLSKSPRQKILHVCNRMFTEHVLLAAWHDAIVISFSKPGKNASDPKCYAPTVLSNCFGKIVKK